MHLKKLLDLTVCPYVSTDLIGAAAMERIQDIAIHLPEKLTSFFGFECRLGNSKPDADFLLCIFTANGERETFAHLPTNKNTLPAKSLKHPIWKNILQFAQNWNDTEHPLHQKVDNVWLEFDVAEDDKALPIPSFFFAPYDSDKNEFLIGLESRNTILAGLNMVKAGAIDKIVSQQLLKVLETLPEKAYVFQVGTMLSRPVQTYRVCIRDIGALEIPAFLKNIGWEGDISKLYNLLETLYSMVDRVDLDIDINEGVAPKIGLECYLEMDEERDHRWETMMNYLYDNNLCTEKKKIALTKFNGFVYQEITENNAWPDHLQQLTGFIGGKYKSMYFRDIHHVKLSFEGAVVLEAKAYLRVRHIWASIPKLKAIFRKHSAKVLSK